jgi:hypothetical protein
VDSLITAAARALAAGDPLGALTRVALRHDAPALALRGIAMAQLGDFVRAKALLRRATLAFGAREPVARARCVVAAAEVALVSRDLNWAAKALAAARATLVAHGEHGNAAHARYLEARHLLLIGRLDAAERVLADLDPAPFAPALRTAHELVVAGIAVRRLRIGAAGAALERARLAAGHARIPALTAEVDAALQALAAPAARLIERGEARLLALAQVEALLASPALVVDACRHAVRQQQTVIALARRPVLFALARVLGDAWPGDASRDRLIAGAFGSTFADPPPTGRSHGHVPRLHAGAAARTRDYRAGAAHRRRARRRAGAAGRWGVVVEFGSGPGARQEPAHRATSTRRSGRRGQGAAGRSGAGAPLAHPAGPGIRDGIVTPGATAA